jgi:predicted phage baseplate assembly protein
MALISPILDNRTYAQLREELVARIPVYAPEWTDHNETDPGIALVELFAYLGESLLYRFNQIPETARIEFLRLLGVQPRPAQPAHALVAATTDQASGVQVLKGTEAKAGSVSFQTEDEVYVWPVELLAAGKTPEEPAATRSGKESSADALARAHLTDPTQARFYRTTLVSTDPLAPDAVVVDVGLQADHALWVAVLTKDATDPRALAGRILFVGVAFDETIAEPVVLDRLDEKGAERFHADDLSEDPPPMLWRLWNGPTAEADGAPFTPLEVVGDTTGGLVRSGVVKLELPRVLPQRGAGTGGEDSPPPLSDPKLAERVLAWIQVSRPSGQQIGDSIGRVRWVGPNAASVVQARTATTEQVGSGTGDADQRYPLSQRPVLPGTVTLQVEESAGWTTWEEVGSFAASTADDRHYVVDLDAGAIGFGHRRVPQIGERIRVLSYQYGGGTAGNLDARSITSLVGVGGVEVSNPLPARGGGDRAQLSDALDAIPGEVHRHDRAVVLDDFRALAEEVPGVRRAEPLDLLQPDSPREVAAGVVSVVVFPDSDVRNPAAPMPDLGLLRRVSRYLDQRRLVTTELYVIPPEYVQITVSVGVQVREGYQVDAVRRWVEQLVRQFLSPLPPLGPDGEGWPSERAVRRAELAAVVVQVDGVEFVEDLLVGLVTPTGVTPTGRIDLERWQFPEVVEVETSVGQPLPLGQQSTPTSPEKVPVPLPPDVC